MSARLGIDLPSLLGAPVATTTTASAGPLSLPSPLARFIARLSLLSYDTAVSDARFVHSGLIQTSLLQDIGAGADDWLLRIPGLFETGLLCVPKIPSALIGRGNRLTLAGNDRAGPLHLVGRDHSVQVKHDTVPRQRNSTRSPLWNGAGLLHLVGPDCPVQVEELA